MDYDKLKERVLANIISIGVIIGIMSCVSVDVKREMYFNGKTVSTYRLRFF
jgi:hypothetical protein